MTDTEWERATDKWAERVRSQWRKEQGTPEPHPPPQTELSALAFYQNGFLKAAAMAIEVGVDRGYGGKLQSEAEAVWAVLEEVLKLNKG